MRELGSLSTTSPSSTADSCFCGNFSFAFPAPRARNKMPGRVTGTCSKPSFRLYMSVCLFTCLWGQGGHERDIDSSATKRMGTILPPLKSCPSSTGLNHLLRQSAHCFTRPLVTALNWSFSPLPLPIASVVSSLPKETTPLSWLGGRLTCRFISNYILHPARQMPQLANLSLVCLIIGDRVRPQAFASFNTFSILPCSESQKELVPVTGCWLMSQ